MEPKFSIITKEQTRDYGLFYIEPLEQGYGQTLGTSIRRVLLTSLPGAAITQVKIAKVRHPLSTIPGMKEDVVEFLLNLKKIRLAYDGDGPAKLTLEKSGKGTITAADIKTPATVKIANPELQLANLADSKSSLSVDIQVETGIGFSPAEERKTDVIGVISLDAIFSPVVRVNYRVEATRVGRLTNYDRLILEVWTDGSISPLESIRKAARILNDYFVQIVSPQLEGGEDQMSESPRLRPQIASLSVEELNVPARIANALVRGGYETVGDLMSAKRDDLASVRNLGEKSLKVVAAALGEHGVAFTFKP